MYSIGPLPLRGPLPLAGGGKMPIPYKCQPKLKSTDVDAAGKRTKVGVFVLLNF